MGVCEWGCLAPAADGGGGAGDYVGVGVGCCFIGKGAASAVCARSVGLKWVTEAVFQPRRYSCDLRDVVRNEGPVATFVGGDIGFHVLGCGCVCIGSTVRPCCPGVEDVEQIGCFEVTETAISRVEVAGLEIAAHVEGEGILDSYRKRIGDRAVWV